MNGLGRVRPFLAIIVSIAIIAMSGAALAQQAYSQNRSSRTGASQSGPSQAELPKTVSSNVMTQLFPYGFATQEAAVSGCTDLVNPSSLANAGRGALVYVSGFGQRSMMPHSVLPSFLQQLADPRDVIGPVDVHIETQQKTIFSAVVTRQGAVNISGVRCWFKPLAGQFRLISIEVLVK